MQPNEIVLAVDEDNSGSGTTNHTFTRFEENLNRSVYISGDHLLDARDTLALYRTLPKVAGNFRGVAKTSLKFTKDVVVLGVDGVSNITAPIIVEVSMSLPVGATAANALIARQKVVTLVDTDTVMAPLMEQQMI